MDVLKTASPAPVHGMQWRNPCAVEKCPLSMQVCRLGPRCLGPVILLGAAMTKSMREISHENKN